MRNSLNHNESGMTLVEILISMLIGAVLLAGVLSIFINQQADLSAPGGDVQNSGKWPICSGFYCP